MCWTGRRHGHLGWARPNEMLAVDRRRRQIVDVPWVYLHQVHGTRVVTVEGPPAAASGSAHEGDGLVTAAAGIGLAVFTADCAPVSFASPEGIIGLAHAGWRGLTAGVIGATVDAMRLLGATRIEAALGPCIRAGCYDFGRRDLATVARALGESVRATTRRGLPALDLAAAVSSALAAVDVPLVLDVGACTACSSSWFSHRASSDTERQATIVWVPAGRP